MTRSRAWILPAILCAALAIVHTWPLATAPAVLSSNDNADAQSTSGLLAGIAHALRAPLHLFQANIFYPAKDTLAFSDADRAGAARCADRVARWLAGAVYKLMVLAGLHADGVSRLHADVCVDGDPRRRAAHRVHVCVQTPYATRLAHVQGLHI